MCIRLDSNNPHHAVWFKSRHTCTSTNGFCFNLNGEQMRWSSKTAPNQYSLQMKTFKRKQLHMSALRSVSSHQYHCHINHQYVCMIKLHFLQTPETHLSFKSSKGLLPLNPISNKPVPPWPFVVTNLQAYMRLKKNWNIKLTKHTTSPGMGCLW